MFKFLKPSKKRLDKNKVLGECCASKLISDDKNALTTLPLGIKEGELTDSFRKGFNSVVENYQKENHIDPLDDMELTAQQMINEGHNRFELVIDYIKHV